MGKVTDTKNPLSLMSVATAMSGGMRIDDKMTYFDALGLAGICGAASTPSP